MFPEQSDGPRAIEVHDSYAVVIGDHAIQINNYGVNTWSYARAKEPLADDSGVIGSPYRGLSVFEASDAALFFGRDAAIAQVMDRMARCMDTTGMLVVSGVSGAGKSSLLRAGVLPRMQRQGLPPVPLAAAWPRILFTPTAQPLNELAVRVASLARTDAAVVRSGLGAEPGLFSLTARQAVAAQATGITGGRLLLVIDQFEQLFTQCEDEAERRAFITALHTAASGTAVPGAGKEAPGAAPPAALVVLGVRADFEARCADYPELAGPVQDRYLLTAMTEAELRAAITEPARRAGAGVEDNLVSHLLDQMRSRQPVPGQEMVTGAGALPLLSHALDQTWRNHSGDSLTLADYQQGGGIEGAVAASAQRAYERLTPAEQATARQVFLRLTATSRDGTDTAVRVTRAELEEGQDPAAVRAVFDAFTAERLLALDSGNAEICHEALLTAWPLFRDSWLAETRADRVVRTRLRDAAGEWAAHDRDPAYLYRGAVLESARAVADRVTAAPQRHGALSQTENAFLRASVRAARVRRRQLQGFAALLGVLVLVLAGVTIATVQANQQTARQRDIAISGELAALSEAPSTDPVQARLDAVAAWRLDPSSGARYAMQSAAMLQELASFGGPPAGRDITAFSPGGTLLAVADANSAHGTSFNVLQIWNAETHSLVRSLRVSGTVTALSFGAGGRVLAVGTLNGGTQLWDMRTMRKVATLYQPGDTRHLESVSAVAFNAAGTVLAIGYYFSPLLNADGVQLWRVNASEPADSAPLGAPFPPPNVLSLAFSPDGGTLAVGAAGPSSGTILWSVAGHREIGEVAPGTTSDAVAFSPDGTTLAVASLSKLQLWNAGSRQLVATLIPKYTNTTPSVDFSPDGATLAVVRNGMAQFWDVPSRKQVGRTFGNGNVGPPVNSAIFSPNGATIAISASTGTQLWSTSGVTGEPQETLGTASAHNSVSATSFGPNGTPLAVEDSNSVRLWNPVTGKPSSGPLAVNTGLSGAHTAFSPDGRYLAIVPGNGTVQLLDTRTRAAATLNVSSEQANGYVAFSPDGTLLAVGANPDTPTNSVVELWNVATRRLVASLPGGGYGAMGALAFSPDGSTLAVLTNAGSTLDLWDVRTHQLRGSFTPAGSGADGVAWSPDGTTLAIASASGTQLWNVASREQDGSTLPSGSGNAVAWSPDGSVLAVASQNGTELWNVTDRQQIGAALTTLDSETLAWSPDGKTLAVGTGDGTVQLWNLAGLRAADTPAYLCAQAGQTITSTQWTQVAPGVPYQDVCP